MRHLAIPSYIEQHNQPKERLMLRLPDISKKISELHSDKPEISVVIPAYNEEENILKTLSSLAASNTRRKVEIIVVNNNSVDATETLIRQAGAICVVEQKQGITHARNAGLHQARGTYLLNADADTIYPPDWIDAMVKPLQQHEVALVYGTFSFLPVLNTPRPVFFVYEYLSDLTKWIDKRFREEAVSVYGFNSGCRREECLQVEGFNHPVGASEDGWLAVKLRTKFSKRLHRVGTSRATVWTTDRRLQIDGGFVKGFLKRFAKNTGGKSTFR